MAKDDRVVGGVTVHYAIGYYTLSGLGTADQCSLGVVGSSNLTGVGVTAPVPSNSAAPATATCPAGQYLGTVDVNGVSTTKCYTAAGEIAPDSADPQSSTTTQKIVTSGTGSQLITTVTDNSTGDTTTTVANYLSTNGTGVAQSITCTGPGCSTNKSSGDGMSEFCAANPTAEACRTTNEHEDYCATHTSDLSCAQLDSAPSDSEVGTLAVGVSSLTPVSLAGLGSSCPANVSLPHGMEFSYGPICTFAEGLSPIIIAMAWLSAALIVIGAKQGD